MTRAATGHVGGLRSLNRDAVRAAAFLVAVLATAAAGWALRHDLSPHRIVAAAQGAGAWAWAAFAGLVVLAEILWLPRMSVVAAGGLVLGPVVAGLVSLAGDLVSASLLFWLGRTGLKGWVRSRLSRRPRVAAALKLVAEREGLLVVALLRVCPVAHYTAFSYACGAWSVGFGRYLAGTAIGLLPGALLYPWLGRALLHPGRTTSLLYAGFLAAFLVGTGWAGRRILRSAEISGSLARGAATGGGGVGQADLASRRLRAEAEHQRSGGKAWQ